jgi:5-methylcytosine-specific restriction protein A
MTKPAPIAKRTLTGWRLQGLRARVFREYPLCGHCTAEGVDKYAEELDHIVPLCKGGTDELENLQGLCKEHHRAKTTADLGYKSRPQIGLDGWPLATPRG